MLAADSSAQRVRGSGLSETEFLLVRNLYASGTSITDALSSIGRDDIPGATAYEWYDLSAEDHLSKRGRSIHKRIRENDAFANR